MRCVGSLPTASQVSCPPFSSLLFAQDADQCEMHCCPLAPNWIQPEGSRYKGSKGGRKVRSGFYSPAASFRPLWAGYCSLPKPQLLSRGSLHLVLCLGSCSFPELGAPFRPRGQILTSAWALLIHRTLHNPWSMVLLLKAPPTIPVSGSYPFSGSTLTNSGV